MPDDDNVLARWTPEESAAFFAGGDLPRARFENRELQRKQDLQHQLLQNALEASVGLYRGALGELSSQTAERLQQLYTAAQVGDQRARQLFLTMMVELMSQALLD
jgi:hypothetical protein